MQIPALIFPRNYWIVSLLSDRHNQLEISMKALTITLAAAASALLMTAASAAPISVGTSGAAASGARDGNIQNVRMVCNEEGRCWREHSERRVIIRDRDAYGYAPRERYIERRDRAYDEDRGGIGFRAPGVSVGIGTDRY
jgi:hypothetical protein